MVKQAISCNGQVIVPLAERIFGRTACEDVTLPGERQPLVERGQMIATHTRPPIFRRIVFGAGGYVVSRPDGRVLCGSTMERVGFERGITFGGMADVIGKATRIAPALASAAIEEHWSSFRPGTLFRSARRLDGFRGPRKFAWAELPSLGPSPEAAFLLKPETYMNLSGDVVVPVARFLAARDGQEEVDPARILVVYDDLDLDLGRLRLRPHGGPGGHNGMRSIIEHLASDQFPRLRVGIGRAGTDAARYVLQPFPPGERVEAEISVAEAADPSRHHVPADAGSGKGWLLHPLSDEFNYTAPPAQKGPEFTNKWKDTFINPWLGPGLLGRHLVPCKRARRRSVVADLVQGRPEKH